MFLYFQSGLTQEREVNEVTSQEMADSHNKKAQNEEFHEIETLRKENLVLYQVSAVCLFS